MSVTTPVAERATEQRRLPAHASSGTAMEPDLDRDLIGTCAFLAAILDGRTADCLWEDGRDRGFLVYGQDIEEPRVWDPLRHSFLYIDVRDDDWRLYDFATARHFRVQKVGETLTFAD